MTSSDTGQAPLLVIITGPTGVGKSDLALSLAKRYQVPIISADSRQIYREMPIGTDAPTPEMMQSVPHRFIATRSITDHYSAAAYESDALAVIAEVHATSPIALLVGGSMMYIDAVAHGIDAIPDVLPNVRTELWQRWEHEGLEPLRQELRLHDPDYLARIDPNNYKRIIHALEVYYSTGAPFSGFHTGQSKQRPFNILKIGIVRPREELYQRINARVSVMVERGLIDEAARLLPYRHLNALNTVGYKELFPYFDGEINLDLALQRIAKDTRVYARKQLTWYRRDLDMHWMHPLQHQEIIDLISSAASK